MALKKYVFLPYEQRVIVENYTGWRGNVQYIASLLGNKYPYQTYVRYIQTLIKEGHIEPLTAEERAEERRRKERLSNQRFREAHPDYGKDYYHNHKEELKERHLYLYREYAFYRERCKEYRRRSYERKKLRKVV